MSERRSAMSGGSLRAAVPPIRYFHPRAELLETRRLLALDVVGFELQEFEGDVIVARGADWKFLDDGSDQATAWREVAFDDSAWDSGPAELGYGDGDEATEIGFGPDSNAKYVTSYFRHTFQLPDAGGVDSLELSVIRDDGVAVYLNGVEVLRDGLAADAGYLDLATATIANAGEVTPVVQTIDVSTLPPGTLIAGANVLAAEVHQASPTSSDLSFDLSLQRDGFLGLTIDFNAAVDIATLEAADLLVDGAAVATGVAAVDADSVRFTLPSLAPGAHAFSILADSIASAGGEAVGDFQQSATIAAADQYRVNHPPRLQPGNAPLAGYAGSELDQVDLLWQTVPADVGAEDRFTAQYRLAGASQAWSEAGAVDLVDTGVDGRVMHSSSIVGLEWNTEYDYRVRHWRADVIAAEYHSTFRTRLQAGDDTPFQFVAYGDSADGAALGFREVQSRINTLDPNFAVLLGDNIYFNGAFDEADSRFDPTINPEAAQWTAGHVDYLGLGNHDLLGDNGRPSELMFSVPVPVAGVSAPAEPPATERPEHNFSWDYGNVHFVTFESTEQGTHNSMADRERLDGLLDYVVADLQASDARWKIVYTHHLVAGAPDKPEDPSDYYYQQVVSRLLGAGADLFLAGHSHTYYWTYPLTGEINGQATFVPGPYNAFETNQGLPQLVSGVGGQSLRSGTFDQHPYVAASFSQSTAVASKNGFTQIDVTPEQLTFSYIGADDGQMIDSFTITAAADLQAPSARLAVPVDNDGADLDPSPGRILVNSALDSFVVDLFDVGDGIDDASVTGAALTLSRNGEPLAESNDYTFEYDAVLNRITLRSSPGGFGDGLYTISVRGDGIADLTGNQLGAIEFSAEVDTALPDPNVASFQQGVVGYLGAHDTFLAQDDPLADHAMTQSLEVDGMNVDGPTQTLLRFDNIFGDQLGQIPADAIILTATLTLDVTNEGDGLAVHRLLQPFADTDNWDDWIDGIQADDFEAAATPSSTTGAVRVGAFEIDVRASLLDWLANPADHFGWALLPTGNNGVDFHSSEAATPPRLEVAYLLPSISTLFVEAADPQPGGIMVRFSRAIDVSRLHVTGSGDTNVALASAQHGLVRGSLAWDEIKNELRFLHTNG
ncbi:MAG: DNRLRE domain-containing protein, partial [Planctomycetales bacterium]|nr:DNRLRE domain-containing protein [Planctomycetales bacterium]